MVMFSQCAHFLFLPFHTPLKLMFSYLSMDMILTICLRSWSEMEALQEKHPSHFPPISSHISLNSFAVSGKLAVNGAQTAERSPMHGQLI